MQSKDPTGRVHDELAALHEAALDTHTARRAALLRRLAEEPIAVAPRVRAWRATAPIAVAVGLLLAALIGLVTAGPTSAMDRIARAINRVNSYSFRFESVYTSTAGEGRIVRDVLIGDSRRSPRALHATIEVVETKNANSDRPAPPITLVNLEETHALGGRGIVIDHTKKQYWWTPIHTKQSDLGNGGPQILIYKVRKKLGRVVQGLGEKELGGRKAYGVKMILDSEDPASGWGGDGDTPKFVDWKGVPIEVWVDAETDLPIEFRTVRRGEDFETLIRVTDLRWNVELAEDRFRPRAPEGYAEIPAPGLED